MQKHQTETIAAYARSAQSYAQKIAVLHNYDTCYDAILEKIGSHARVLDLACGPANISGYLKSRNSTLQITGYDLAEPMLLLAQQRIPDGKFIVQDIVQFRENEPYDLVLNGFGLPYLDADQRKQCFHSMRAALRPGGWAYISFMEGAHEGFENTSYSPTEQFYIYYHLRDEVRIDLAHAGFTLEKQWVLDYHEADGSITSDIVLLVTAV